MALAKVVGEGADGKPILEQLSPAEKRFINKRYRRKTLDARRAGRIPDAAEHGVTLIGDDVSASAARVVIPKYGAPFLPKGVGEAFLKRIAPFVKPAGKTVEEMVTIMTRLVENEGGFGQHAVVVTSDSRYFGELAVSAW